MHCIDPDRRCTDCVRVCKYNGIDSVINKHPAQQVVLIQTKRVINTFGNRLINVEQALVFVCLALSLLLSVKNEVSKLPGEVLN